MIFGINPGRFGAVLPGIPFTDPIRLKKECGIDNHLPKNRSFLRYLFMMLSMPLEGPGKSFQKNLYHCCKPAKALQDTIKILIIMMIKIWKMHKRFW